MNEPSVPSFEALTELSHKLIRQACKDDFDPFMIGNHSEPGQPLVRACFYYAVVMTDQHTVLFDNEGRGGMCSLATEEMVAVWDTPALLASQGLTLEQMRAGVPLPLTALEVPRPRQIQDDLPPLDDIPSKGVPSSVSLDPRFDGSVALSELLKRDRELLCFLVQRLPKVTEEDDLPAAPPKRRPGLG